MELFGIFFPFFFILIFAFAIWNWLEQSRFTRFDGNLKRGVMIWADSLSWETRQWLEAIPATFQNQQGFIRKEGREILIVTAEPRLWGIFSRRRRWPYIAYANLAEAESRIEFRLPWSILASLVILTPLVFTFFLVNFFRVFFRNGFELAWSCFFPAIFLVIMFASILYNHHRERKRLLDFLKRATEQTS
jgi:hypothetical protein